MFDRINPLTDPWTGAEAQAREKSAGWGIPFTTFDPVLTDAKKAMRELVQVAVGNEAVPFSALNTRYTGLMERLQELAQSVPPVAGSVSDIDTTPSLPRPPQELIAGAALCIPAVLADIVPRPGETVELVAAVLANRVQGQGHILAAAHWAIHEAVRAGRLTAGRVRVDLPQVIGPGSQGLPEQFFGTHAQRGPCEPDLPRTGTKPIPKDRPAPFDCFTVTAAPALWEWWTAQAVAAPESAQSNATGRDATSGRAGERYRFLSVSGVCGALPTAKIPGVTSLNVLRAHLEMTAFPDWRQRMQSWPEVPYLRLHCARLFVGQPFTAETIELLIAWFQTRGLTPEQARHLPLADAMRLIDAEQSRAPAEREPAAPSERQPPQTEAPRKRRVAPKRSTQKGEGRLKLVAALTKYHRYAEGGCLNAEPINNNELARLAGVSGSTASAFFEKEFKGYDRYRVLCQQPGELAAALKLLNGEFAPHHLFGGLDNHEGEADTEE